MYADVAEADRCGPLCVADALCNGRALATLLASFVAVALLGLLAFRFITPGSALVAVPPAVAVAALGLTAAGSQFAAQAAGRPIPGVLQSFLAAPPIVLRIVLLAGLLSLVLLAFVLVVALVLLVCRLPLVGALLYVVALPVLTIAGAALLLVLTAVALLSLPALWEGHSLRTVLSQALAIAEARKLQAFADLLLFLVIAGLLAAVAAAFVLAGFALATGLPLALDGGAPGLGDVSLPRLGEWLMDVDGFAVAGYVGAALVVAVMLALVSAVFLFGLAAAYRRSTRGIDIAAARAALGRTIVEMQVKRGQLAYETRRLASRAIEAIRERAGGGRRVLEVPPTGASATEFAVLDAPLEAAFEADSEATPWSTSEARCPACDSPAAPDDRFCGHCGRRLSKR